MTVNVSIVESSARGVIGGTECDRSLLALITGVEAPIPLSSDRFRCVGDIVAHTV